MGAGKARRSVLSLPSVTDENGFKYLSTTCLPQCRLLPIPSGGRCLILLTWSGLEQGRQADPRKHWMLGAPELEGRLSVGAPEDENRSRRDACRARPARPRRWHGSRPETGGGRGRGRGVQARTAPGTSGAGSAMSRDSAETKGGSAASCGSGWHRGRTALTRACPWPCLLQESGLWPGGR